MTNNNGGMEDYRKRRLEQINAKKKKRKPLAWLAWVAGMFLFICSVDSYYGGWPWYVSFGFITVAFFVMHKGAMYLETGKR